MTDSQIMKYSVVLTDTSKQDLRNIAIWIAEQSKEIEIAKHFVNELRNACQKLETLPYRGAFPKDRILKNLGYRFIVHKDYLIFYLIDEEEKTVNIMAVFNAKKDYSRIFKNWG